MCAMDGGDLRLGVVELEAVGAVADVGRVDLELHPDDEPVAGVDAVVAEHDAPVAAGLADRRGLDRVELHALDPALVEDEPRVLDGAQRADLDARLEEQPAAHRRRRGHAQRRPRACARRSGSRPARRRRAGPAPRSRRRSSCTARRAHRPTVAPRGSGAAATSVNRLVTRTRFGGARNPSCVVVHHHAPPFEVPGHLPQRPPARRDRRLAARAARGARERGHRARRLPLRAGHGDRGRPRHAPGDHGASSASSPIAPRSRPAGPPRRSGA